MHVLTSTWFTSDANTHISRTPVSQALRNRAPVGSVFKKLLWAINSDIQQLSYLWHHLSSWTKFVSNLYMVILLILQLNTLT